MKKSLLILLLAFTSVLATQANWDTLVYDDFQDSSQYVDVSKRLIWAPNTVVQSAFRLTSKTATGGTFNAIYMTDTAAAHKKYNITNGLRESTAIDYLFSDTVDRYTDTMVVEFDVVWDALDAGGNTYRIVCAIMHEYPDTGIAFGSIDSINWAAPFGRPAYNFRILARTPQGVNNYGNLFHGGGKDLMGEFEKYSSTYWLPGFISGPGGVSPEGAVEYPEGPVLKWRQNTIASTTNWCHYKVLVMKDSIQWFYRQTVNPATMDQRLGTLYTPTPKDTASMIAELNSYYKTSITDLPDLYTYFRKFIGVRLFMNGNKTFMANVTVRTTKDLSTKNSIVSEKKTKIRVFPNPSSGILTITGIKENTTVELFDISGKKILSSTETTINLGQLAQGIYILKAENEIFKVMKK